MSEHVYSDHLFHDAGISDLVSSKSRKPAVEVTIGGQPYYFTVADLKVMIREAYETLD